MTKLIDARWGSSETPLPDWRKQQFDELPDDDEELADTPSDVIEMLGFDPKELSETK